MAEAFIRKYSLKIGRNKELIRTTVPEQQVGPYTPEGRSDYNLFDVLSDYSYHKYDTRDRNQLDQFLSASTTVNYGYTDVATIPAQSITFTDLNLEVEVKDNKDTKSSSSQGAIARIFNVSPENRNFIRVGNSFILHAGFEDDGDELPLIYVGQVESVRTISKPPDNITELVLKPAKLQQGIKINRSYPPGVTLDEIITDLLGIAASKGIPTGEFFRTDSYLSILNREMPFGYNATGDLLSELQELCSDNRHRAYIVKGKLYVHPVGLREYKKVVRLYPEQIKGTPEKQEDGSNSTQQQSGSSKGYGLRVTTPLNGNIDTACMIKLMEGEYQGTYVVQSVQHIMNLEGQEWDTILTLTLPK